VSSDVCQLHAEEERLSAFTLVERHDVEVVAMEKIKVIMISLLCVHCTSANTFDANNPGASGYKLVFSEYFTDMYKFDLNNTRAPGYTWYMDRFYWNTPAPPNSVSLGPNGLVLSDTIATAGLSGARGSPMVGKAWGGGAYFEAEILFNPDQVFIENGDWPAFYGLSWEFAGDTDQAPGKPLGYKHFGEIDFMEYGFWNHLGQPPDYRFFWQTIHDFYGVQNVTCSGRSYCQIMNNNTSSYWAGDAHDIHGWHRYGALWITGKRHSQGSVQEYIDGKPLGGPVSWGLVTWPAGQGNVTPPTSQTAYSILDRNHSAIVLQGSLFAPITVKYVKVWQLPRIGTCVGEC
jgi:hypothetical protein